MPEERAEKKKVAPRKKIEWFINSVLVLIYSLLLVGCFFILLPPYMPTHVILGDWISFFLVVLVSVYISFVLHDLKRTLAIYFLSSLLGHVLTSVTFTFLFHSYASYSIEIEPYTTIRFSPALLILGFVISFFFLSTLGAIAGDYVAEKRKMYS
jgi:hypothetical protein